MTGGRTAAGDTLVLARRSLLRIPRQPDLLLAFTVQPVMFVLLFVYVFGGAITTPGFTNYTNFVIPGIVVQAIAFGGFVTALGLAEDVKKGLIDRFRSLPIWGPSVVTGRILSDVATNGVQLVVLFSVSFAVGFRFEGSTAEVIGGLALLVLIGNAFSWVFAVLGLVASSPEAANGYGFVLLFPITFVSSAFVPPQTMPAWLQPLAEGNPFTKMVDATRSLFLGLPAGNSVWLAVAWAVGIIVVFAPLASWRYRRTTTR